MKRPRTVLFSMLAALLCGFVTLSTGVALIGRPARLVDVVAVFFGGFGSGAAFVAAILNLRASNDSSVR